MSNFVNDQIADTAIDTVAAMTDVQVARSLPPENLTIVAGYTGVENDGRGPMDYARQLVKEQLFDEVLEARSI